MKRQWRGISCIGLAIWLLASGCQLAGLVSGQPGPGSVVPIEPGQPFTIAFNQSGRFAEADINIKFTELLEESRCPTNVQCVEAGQARVLLVVGPSAGPNRALELNTNPPLELDVVQYLDYQIRLLELAPYPEDIDQPAAAEDYTAQLVLTEAP